MCSSFALVKPNAQRRKSIVRNCMTRELGWAKLCKWVRGDRCISAFQIAEKACMPQGWQGCMQGSGQIGNRHEQIGLLRHGKAGQAGQAGQAGHAGQGIQGKLEVGLAQFCLCQMVVLGSGNKVSHTLLHDSCRSKCSRSPKPLYSQRLGALVPSMYYFRRANNLVTTGGAHTPPPLRVCLKHITAEYIAKPQEKQESSNPSVTSSVEEGREESLISKGQFKAHRLGSADY